MVSGGLYDNRMKIMSIVDGEVCSLYDFWFWYALSVSCGF